MAYRELLLTKQQVSSTSEASQIKLLSEVINCVMRQSKYFFFFCNKKFWKKSKSLYFFWKVFETPFEKSMKCKEIKNKWKILQNCAEKSNFDF